MRPLVMKGFLQSTSTVVHFFLVVAKLGCMVKLMMETSGSFCWGVGMVSESLIMMLRDSSEEARDCIG